MNMMTLRRTAAYAREGRRELVTLALFFYVFLAGETVFSEKIALFVGPSSVMVLEAAVLGASVVGFLLRPLLLYRTRRMFQVVPGIISVLTAAAFVVVLMAQQLGVAVVGGVAAFGALGYAGSAAHAFVSRRYARSPNLAKTVAISYAGGVLLQFICESLLPEGIPQQLMLVVSAIALVVLLRVNDGPDAHIEAPSRGPGADHKTVVRLTVATACLTMVFAGLNAVLDTSHVVGVANLGGWSRLVLAASAIVAGHLFDLRCRHFTNIVMLCAALLSTLSLFLVIAGGNVTAASALFYAGSGFFVVFFTYTFMALAPTTRFPELWPSMGRAINNLCGIVMTAPALALADRGPVQVTCAMVALCVVLVLVLTGPLAPLEQSVEPEFKDIDRKDASGSSPVNADAVPAPLSLDDRLAGFSRTHGFSEREAEVLRALVTSEGSMQQVADGLYLSRSTLYRHVASMSDKAGASSRAALIKAFWSWEDRR